MPSTHLPPWGDDPPVDRITQWVVSWTDQTSQITICIPSRDRLDLLIPCLLSLEKTTRGYPVDVIIGDTGSGPAALEFYKKTGIPVFRFPQPFNFSVVCNGLAKYAKADNLLFLNNDTVVLTEGWPKLLMGREEVIGALLLFIDGNRIHHAGLEINPRENSDIPFCSAHTGYGVPIDDLPKLDLNKAVAQTGAFLYVPKAIFEMLGGFDVAFRLDLQDADFGIRAREMGVPVSCCEDIRLLHASGASRKNYTFPVNDWKFFCGRRQSSLRQWMAAKDIARRREAGRVLIVDDHAPDPEAGFHVPRFRTMLDFLSEMDYRVTFFATNGQGLTGNALDDMLLKRGIDTIQSAQRFESFAEEYAGFFDTVILSRPHNFGRFHRVVREKFPKARLIYDSEALFFLRSTLKTNLFGLNPLPAREEKKAELDMMVNADRIIAVSEYEKKIILGANPKLAGKVFVWGHSLPVQTAPPTYGERRGLLFTGNLNAENPNEDSIVWFVNEVYPKVFRETACALTIVGSNPTARVSALASDSIRVMGYVPAEDMPSYYAGHRVFLVPTRFAAGIPWKLHEAMSYGIPAVVTELIQQQLGLNDGKEVLVARNATEFADQVIRLYSEEGLWRYVREQCVNLVRMTCNPIVQKGMLARILS